MTITWSNQRIDNNFPVNTKTSHFLTSRAFIFALVIHLLLALLITNLVPPILKKKPVTTIKKNKIKAIQSYLYRRLLPSLPSTSEKPPEFKTIKKPFTKNKTKPAKAIKSTKTKKIAPLVTSKLPAQTTLRSKNSLSFSALEHLKQRQQQLDQQSINNDINYHNRARGESIFNDLPAAVKHSEKILTLSEKKEKMTTHYGGSTDTNLIKFLPNSELCSMFNNKANLFRSSHSKSNKFNEVSGHRASSQRASLKGLYAALLILTREQPFSSINALPLSLLILAEWERT